MSYRHEPPPRRAPCACCDSTPPGPLATCCWPRMLVGCCACHDPRAPHADDEDRAYRAGYSVAAGQPD